MWRILPLAESVNKSGTGTIAVVVALTASGAKKTAGIGQAITVSAVSFVAVGRKSSSGSGTIGVAPSLSAPGTKGGIGKGTLTATATLAAVGKKLAFGSGLIGVVVGLISTGIKRAFGTGSITVTVNLTGSGGTIGKPFIVRLSGVQTRIANSVGVKHTRVQLTGTKR